MAVVGSKGVDVCVSASSPMHFSTHIRDNYDVSEHDAGCIVRFQDSEYFMVIDSPSDVPFRDVRDPSTGKFLVKYEVEQDKSLNYCIRIRDGE